MALYLGEAVRIRVTATDPETKLPLDPPPASGKVDFWAPGKDPVKNLTDRAAPDLADQAMTYRNATSDFVLFQDTVGLPWVAGKWSYRVTVTGVAFSNWEYGTFALKA